MDNGELHLTKNPEPEPFAFEVRTYGHSPSGYTVTERAAISGELPDWFPRFVTNVIHTIHAGDKQYQKSAANVPVPGNDIYEAMAALPTIVKTISEQLHREMMAKLTGKTLVLPGDPGFRR